MASHNGYYDESRRPLGAGYNASPVSPYDGHNPFSSRTAQTPYDGDYLSSTTGGYGGHHTERTSPNNGQSPFASVFDDNYATTSTTSFQQHGPYVDTSYQGHGVTAPSPSQRHANDDIPLQDRTGKYGDVNDHVYDASEARPAEPRSRKKKVRVGELGMLGADKKRIPWVCYVFTAVQVGVFIGEIIKNGILTGSPIMIKPQFNPMIGPSTQVMINMGARFVPCMHNIKEIQGSDVEVQFLCPNATSNDQICPLSEVCGFGGVPNPVGNNFDQKPEPNQWFRFILPMFLHAGIIHIGFNMLLQMTLAKEMEQAIGSVRFFVVYVSAGIFGFVMGGNFAAPGIASTGASGSLFGIIALMLLDLLYSWKDRRNPVKDLMFILLDVVISFVLGLLPGLDNFSHIGGFLMGLALGVCVLHSPNALRVKMDGGGSATYLAMNGGQRDETAPAFFKSPVGFFKGRKPLWWIWWLVRAGALIAIIIVFIVLLNNFYNVHSTCSWCKYLSCLPVSNWCELGTIQVKST